MTGTTMLASYTGDSSLLIAESPTGAATDAIVNDGRLLVNNTTTAITLSHISGAGDRHADRPGQRHPDDQLLSRRHRRSAAGSLFVGDDRALGGGDVSNQGTLAAAPGQPAIAVAGDYRQGARGVLRLGGGPGGAVLRVAGRAEIDGQLRLPARGAAGKRPVVRAAGGLRGRFRSIVAGDREVSVSYDGTTCYVTRPRAKKRSSALGLVAAAD